jgi:hypothetical protein
LRRSSLIERRSPGNASWTLVQCEAGGICRIRRRGELRTTTRSSCKRAG